MTHRELLTEGMVFGPFKSEHQIATVDSHFREGVYACLEACVLPKMESAFTRIKGTLGGYDDPKYFGPLSLVKYRYSFSLEVFAPGSRERADGRMDYNPETKRMGIVGTHIESLSAQKQRIVDRACLSAVLAKIVRGDSDIPCPYCRKLLQVYKDGNLLQGITCIGCRKMRVRCN